MIEYGLLGAVTARHQGWAAELRPKHQLLAAVLALEAGRPVPRDSLIRVLWGEDEERVPKNPDSALNQVVSELRGQLRAAPGQREEDPVAARGDTYRLLVEPALVDALRFRAKVAAARRGGDDVVGPAWREALLEWGPTAHGLFGGQPFSGLRGAWVEGNRHELRREYRDVRLRCLWQDYNERRYEQVATECRQLADGSDALSDEEFLGLWMVATYQAGHRLEVERIYRHAAETVTASLDVRLSSRITNLAEVIRTEDPRLNGPADLFGLDVRRSAPETAIVIRPDNAKRDQEKPMSSNGHTVTFNNSGNTRVGVQANEVSSSITINMESAPADSIVTSQPADPASPSDGSDPDTVAVRAMTDRTS